MREMVVMVCLLNEVDESLSLHEFLKETSIFLDVLHVVCKVEYFIRAISTVLTMMIRCMHILGVSLNRIN
jgi:hypothetical protein